MPLQALRGALVTMGFRVYPDEFPCKTGPHPLVDVAARMGLHYWAFEYKSRHDSIARGVRQCQAYAHWFDYVVLVTARAITHRSSTHYWHLRAQGFGLWRLTGTDRCTPILHPQLQHPEKHRKRYVRRKFAHRTTAPRGPGSTLFP